jgi:hypothetical protein
MKSPRRLIFSAFLLALISAPVLAQPGELLRNLRESLKSRLFPDVSADQKSKLAGIRRDFLTEARPTLRALAVEARVLLGSIQEILSDEQESKIRQLIGEIKDLSLSRKFALLRRLGRSLRGEEFAKDVGLCLGGAGTAEEKVQAADRIARRAVEAVTGLLSARGAFGENEKTAIARAVDGFLERTRAQRAGLGKLAEGKLHEAWGALTDEQRSRLELARSLALAWLSGGTRG